MRLSASSPSQISKRPRVLGREERGGHSSRGRRQPRRIAGPLDGLKKDGAAAEPGLVRKRRRRGPTAAYIQPNSPGFFAGGCADCCCCCWGLCLIAWGAPCLLALPGWSLGAANAAPPLHRRAPVESVLSYGPVPGRVLFTGPVGGGGGVVGHGSRTSASSQPTTHASPKLTFGGQKQTKKLCRCISRTAEGGGDR